MTYGEIKTYLRSLINRTDITDALATQFLQQAQDRCERLCRNTFMERMVDFNLDGTGGDWRVPEDMLQLIELWTDDGQIRRVEGREWLRHGDGSGIPEVFLQTGHDIRLRPYPDADTVIFLRYYGTEPELVVDVDQNYWTTAAVDLLTYAAAALAGDYYEDERLARFEDKFQSALAEIKDQQASEDFGGPMAISPAYRLDQD